MTRDALTTPDVRTGAFAVRRLTAEEAIASRRRLAEIYRDAVLFAAPKCYTAAQVAAWAASAEEADRQTLWLRVGATWVASTTDDPQHLIGLGSVHPTDHVHWLYVDPNFHRRGIARLLLRAIEREARAAGIALLSANASLNAHPVFLNAGFEVAVWEESPHRGEIFRRALMRKALT